MAKILSKCASANARVSSGTQCLWLASGGELKRSYVLCIAFGFLVCVVPILKSKFDIGMYVDSAKGLEPELKLPKRHISFFCASMSLASCCFFKRNAAKMGLQ